MQVEVKECCTVRLLRSPCAIQHTVGGVQLNVYTNYTCIENKLYTNKPFKFKNINN